MTERITARWPHEFRALADQFAQLALHNIEREYPNKLDHVLNSRAEQLSPRELHPVFYGSYDWHSAVHMHWMLARLLRLQPDLSLATEIGTVFDRHFSASHVAQEIVYLQQPSRGTFERTYGWAWLLKLQIELEALVANYPHAVQWRDALQPLATEFVSRYLQFLPKAQFPIRAGTHANSAFGLLFAFDYAQTADHGALRSAVAERAMFWFGGDQLYPANYEPGGDDFLSGGLVEAALMSQVLSEPEFSHWWTRFCPSPEALLAWFDAVPVTDRSDAKMSHLDGLNLSRAWCWRILKKSLPHSLIERVDSAIQIQLAASLPHAGSGNYVGTHWLASFATLALTDN